MPLKNQKWLKIAKISLITILCITCFALPIFAVYTSGDYNTPRYYAPLRFDFEIFGTTAQLTPTISYKSGQTLTYDTTETATQGVGSTAVLNSISRTNFAVSTLADGCLDVSYRLKFTLNDSVDNFSMRIVNEGGIYDFAKYGVPQIAVPFGYTATATTHYTLRFTQAQTSNTNVANVTINGDYSNSLNIPLLRTNYTLNGTDYDIVGGVIIEDYITEITFTKDGSDPMWGNVGFYQWNTVLESYTEYMFEIFALSEDDIVYLYSRDPFYCTSSVNGVVTQLGLDGILFTASLDDGFELQYSEINNGNTFIVYNFTNSEWHYLDGNGDNDLGYVGEDLSSIELRTLYFDEHPYTLFDTFYVSTSDGELEGSVAEQGRLAFLQYIRENTTYYESNPLQTVLNSDGVTYSFTDGDGGMYLHYYVDPSLNLEYDQTMRDLYNYGVTVGYGNGGGQNTQFTSKWIGNAVKGVMEVEIFPNFTLGAVLGAIVTLGVTIALLKYFAGG